MLIQMAIMGLNHGTLVHVVFLITYFLRYLSKSKDQPKSQT